jgi:hypothetical protein
VHRIKFKQLIYQNEGKGDAPTISFFGIGFNVWRKEVREVKPEDIAQKVAWVREAAGERFEHIELGYTVFHMALSNGETNAALPPFLHVLNGDVEQVVETLLAQREQYDFSYIQVQEWQMEAFAPVVTRLTGK